MAGPSHNTPGPHAHIPADDLRARFLVQLFDRLWERYRQRVSYVQMYERVIQQAKATFVNDHIAFRTIAWNRPAAGIASVARIFVPLGYHPAGCYSFPDQHLDAIHYQHPQRQLPKLFVSELRSWELPEPARQALGRSLACHRTGLDDTVLAQLASLSPNEPTAESLLEALVDYFHQLPWPPPAKEDVLAVNQHSQYGAWVLVHGYAVNHFTSLINSHNTPHLDDIEKTVQALREAGVPMKDQIEGARGSKLRQTATQAVDVEVHVRDGDRVTTMPWSYAYFELAERGTITDPETRQTVRFEGFLGPQAAQLFQLTRR